MSIVGNLSARFSRIMNDAASAAIAIARALSGAAKIQLIEGADGEFELRSASRKAAVAGGLRFVDGRLVESQGANLLAKLAGAEVEIVLAASRFLFRALELPEKAQGFLDAIVAGQIDRLTPWTPAQAAFGRGAPSALPGGRLGVQVAATSQARIAPFVNAAEAFKPRIRRGLRRDAGLADPHRRLEAPGHREGRMRRMRARLVGGLAVAGATAAVALVVWVYVGGSIEAAREDIARQIVAKRVAMAGRRGEGDEATAALARMKRESAPSVIVLEKLSHALPDDTYLTGLKIADGKVEISGVTHEAAALIKVLEQTDAFQRATFSAPTTQAPADDNERFQIEAKIKPAIWVKP